MLRWIETEDIGTLRIELSDEDADLPCPWCFAATAEMDEACPNCRRRFGSVAQA